MTAAMYKRKGCYHFSKLTLCQDLVELFCVCGCVEFFTFFEEVLSCCAVLKNCKKAGDSVTGER